MNEYKINHYKQLVSFLGRALGDDYEVVLTDLKTVLAISNGHVSGRSAGVPISDMARKMVKSHQFSEENYKLNYRGRGANGKMLRSSTFFLKAMGGKLEGLLCINFDDSKYHELAERLFKLCHPEEYFEQNISITQIAKDESETFYSDIPSMIEAMYTKVTGDPHFDSRRLTYDEKLRIVTELYQNGVFSIKGTIPEIAERMDISNATLYRYIKKVKEEQDVL